MSIQIIRDALRALSIKGADTATMRYGAGNAQIYMVDGVEIERPAGEMVGESAVALVHELTKKS